MFIFQRLSSIFVSSGHTVDTFDSDPTNDNMGISYVEDGDLEAKTVLTRIFLHKCYDMICVRSS